MPGSGGDPPGTGSGPDTIADMRISRRAAAISPFYAMEYGRRAAELIADGHDVIRFNIGEPDFGAPPAFLAAARDLCDGRPLPYTDALGSPTLREAIARFYSDHFRCDVPARRVVVTSGASAALLMACAALVDPGDEVLIADPSYPCNRQFAESFGAAVHLVPTTVSDRFQLTADSVSAAWTDATRVVMVATPSNPTGTSVPAGELAAICDVARARGGRRIVDEIYLGLADPDGSHPDLPPRSVLAADPDAIVINSFSKYFGHTGWRHGWAIVPDDLVEVFERLAQNYYICPPTPSQFAALTCFGEESLAVAEARRTEFRERRTLVLEGLAAIGLDVPVVPDGAFYVYIDVSSTGLTASRFCDRALTEAHVALTPGKDFGVAGADRFVRLSYSVNRSQLSEGISRLARFTR